MPALSFSVFRDKIESGAKRQTIRSVRKRAIATGDKLFLYWKQQSPKDCEKLGEATCVKTYDVEIHRKYLITHQDNRWETVQYLNSFAKDDGFNNWDEMIMYFEKSYGLPFKGVLIQWNSIIKDPDPELVEALNDWSFRTEIKSLESH